MPKGPKGEKRPADTNACAVQVAKIATGEIEDQGYTEPGRRKSGIAGAEARKNALTASKRKQVAYRAAKERWKKERGGAMTTARQELAERFTEMKKSGLKDMKFFLGEVSEATVEHVCADVNRVLKMHEAGRYTVLDKWNDKPDS